MILYIIQCIVFVSNAITHSIIEIVELITTRTTVTGNAYHYSKCNKSIVILYGQYTNDYGGCADNQWMMNETTIN